VGLHNEATREAWLEKILKQIRPGSRILDAGAGELKYRKFCSHLDYVSQDFARYDGGGNSQGLQMGSWDQSRLDIVSNITSIPELDGSFDAIMCVEVFEHLPDPLLALKEFRRLLKNDGTLIITAPFCSLTHFAPFHFYSGFNKYFYMEHLPKMGFIIREIVGNGNHFEYIAQEIRRIGNIAARYAGDGPRIWEKAAMAAVLNMLARFSAKDSGSEETLAFGFHVVAVKSEAR
jgi:SAM-dependent methyltransferase